MAKDPAFLFYPGDYLRDTQCLSEKSQVAYDRIMCEHMRNICISQEQLNFFTKKLSDDEKQELLFVLTKTAEGFLINWVAESIEKRREYSDSRRKNRSPKEKTHDKHIKTYDSHMENENENENENISGTGKGGAGGKTKFIKPDIPQIENYLLQKHSELKPEQIKSISNEFFDYYQSNGWKVGKNPMKDYQAAIRNWLKRSKEFKNNGNTSTDKVERVGRMAKSDLEEFMSRPTLNIKIGGLGS